MFAVMLSQPRCLSSSLPEALLGKSELRSHCEKKEKAARFVVLGSLDQYY
jgi:hypothetical protein